MPFAINAKAGETCGAFPTPLLTVFCYNLFCTWTAEGCCTRDLPERLDPASVALLLEVPRNIMVRGEEGTCSDECSYKEITKPECFMSCS